MKKGQIYAHTYKKPGVHMGRVVHSDATAGNPEPQPVYWVPHKVGKVAI